MTTNTQLATTEQDRLTVLETIIEAGIKSFKAVGDALLEVRDSRLYRSEYDSFEQYCTMKWQIERRHAYRLIDAATVVKNVSHGTHPAPDSERQARPLTQLPADEQRAAWQEAVETAPEGKVTARHVQAVVARRVTPKAEPVEPEAQVEPEPATPAPTSRKPAVDGSRGYVRNILLSSDPKAAAFTIADAMSHRKDRHHYLSELIVELRVFL